MIYCPSKFLKNKYDVDDDDDDDVKEKVKGAAVLVRGHPRDTPPNRLNT